MLDLGVKTSTLKLAERGFDVHVLPQTATAEEVLALAPDALFFSNGRVTPVHPTATSSCRARRSAPGCRTSASASTTSCSAARSVRNLQLPFGHRGINQPVLDKATGRVEITAHNHGFAVDALDRRVSESSEGFGRVEVSHYGLNDNVVEGLNCLDIPAFSRAVPPRVGRRSARRELPL